MKLNVRKKSEITTDFAKIPAVPAGFPRNISLM